MSSRRGVQFGVGVLSLFLLVGVLSRTIQRGVSAIQVGDSQTLGVLSPEVTSTSFPTPVPTASTSPVASASAPPSATPLASATPGSTAPPATASSSPLASASPAASASPVAASPVPTPLPTTAVATSPGPDATPLPVGSTAVNPLPPTEATPATTSSDGTPKTVEQQLSDSLQVVRAAAVTSASSTATALPADAIILRGNVPRKYDLTVEIHSDVLVIHPERDADGNWSYVVNSLDSGQHVVTVKALDPITNTTYSASKSFLVQKAEAASLLNSGPDIAPDPFRVIPPFYAGLFVLILVLATGLSWLIYRRHLVHDRAEELPERP